MARFTRILLAAVVLAGCKGEPSQTRELTLSHFRSWTEEFQAWKDAGLAVHEKDIFEKTIRGLENTDRHYRWMKEDGWGRPFRWTTSFKEDGAIVLIRSAGPDGVWDNRDDMAAEITIPKQGPVSLSIRQ